MIIERKDPDKAALAVFDPASGTKIRMAEVNYTKSTWPELVDIKITDFCAYGCVFCYQGSTKKGRHGELTYIRDCIKELAKMQCFEIALGGGETTSHPNFTQIVSFAAVKGIVPNFTTFGTEWMIDPFKLAAVRSYVGGIGVSVHSSTQIKKFQRIKKAMAGYRPLVAAQHVFGTVRYSEMEQLLDGIDNLLLLGYKTSGFGDRFTPFKYTEDDICRLIDKARVLKTRLSVDTAFVERYRPILSKCGIPDIRMASPEGKFSCYIDAVEKQIGPSSYCPKTEMQNMPDDDIGSITQRFKQW